MSGSLLRRDGHSNVTRTLEQRGGTPLGARQPALERGACADDGLLHVEVLETHLARVQRVRDRGLEHLLHDAGAQLGRELQGDLGLLDGLAADQLQHLVALARGDPHVSLNGSRFHGLLPGGGHLLGGGLLTVPAEDAGRHELAELVSDHVLGDVNRDEFVAVVYRQRVADEFGYHGRAARPRLDDALFPAAVHRLDLLEQCLDDVGTLLDRTRHRRLSLLLPATHDERIAQLATTGLEALGDLAPRRAGMPAARGLAFTAAHRVVDGVHRDAAHRRAAAAPARPARLPVRDVFVL